MLDRLILDARSVDITRSGKQLLDDVDMQVRSGEHWALLGANGAGKSTLLALLGARMHPTRGQVHVLGHRLGRVDMRELREYLGHVDPRHEVTSPLPVREVVLTGLTNTPEPVPRRSLTREQIWRAEHLIDMLGIGAIADSPWQLLSQGERTRTLIARALMPAPRLLLLDEPATGLDLAGREQLLSRLCRLAAEHPELASVTVTHHLEDLPPHTSHALLLRNGQRLRAGPADDVLTTHNVSRCFDHPVIISRKDGRWSARSAPSAPNASTT
ncbi:ABC transporter ATP-binding protein [Pseudonocardia phyllosphaerae]|uniref:ABC transporter ATP-binding protein n=1 Tax=Pseudonocardia phyllosphaerae TaxID=3390502 RepID=UPI00397C607B